MKYILLFILTVLVFNAFAQRTVSGEIVDVFTGEEQEIQGVCIREAETNNMVYTNMDGKFYLTTLNNTCSLHISLAGYISQTVRITQDTVIHIVLELDEVYSDEVVFMGHTWWEYHLREIVSVGAKYDAVNSMLGMTVSNGYDELRLLPYFRDDRFVYQMNFQTNFGRDYMFDVKTGWMMYRWVIPGYYFPRKEYRYQSHIKHSTFISAGYLHYYYPSMDFIYRDFHVSALMFLKYQTALNVKTGYQTLNNSHNWGVAAEFQKTFGFLKPGLSVGISAGYYFDYFTYSINLQGIYFSDKRVRVGMKLAFEKIDRYDFLNVGLNYFFHR